MARHVANDVSNRICLYLREEASRLCFYIHLNQHQGQGMPGNSQDHAAGMN